MRFLRALPALLLIAAAPASRYTIDGAASEVSAKVAFFGVASKTARFPGITGGITLSPARPEAIDLTVTIDATTLTAPDKLTMTRLKGPRFFDVRRYPTIVFTGASMTMTGERDAEIAGSITARGVTRPATLAVRFTEPPLRSAGRRPLALDGETVIDRRDFGMTSYPLIVGRNVTIRIRAALVPA